MKILCIGGSNTYGYDPRSYIGSRYPEEVRWTDRLGARKLDTGQPNDREVVNSGINGLTVPRNIPVFTDLVRKKDPDLVIVMLGTNDLLEGASADQVCGRMEEFLDAIRETGKPVLLISPPYLKRGEYVQSEALEGESQRLGKLLRTLADKKHCLFADAGEWNIDMSFDGIHFSPEGHKTFSEKMAELLGIHFTTIDNDNPNRL